MTEFDQAWEVRDSLHRSWMPFFGRFGRILPVQVQSIPHILNGASVVIASPTASGKTEAVMAPVAERFLRDGWRDTAIVYVVPTRALANDTLARIGSPLQEMGLTCAIKHGDVPQLPRQLPNVLITTPESVDSLLCRHPEVFLELRTIVLDEIHLIDGTHRGDQVRVLLERLRRHCRSGQFATHVLSATLAEPDAVAQRYVADYQLIVVPGQRDIEVSICSSAAEVYQLTRARRFGKLLFFCNKREAVEQLAAELGQLWHPYPVVSHHGSLSRQAREDAESMMKDSEVAVCVATSTLEVGIDIGDIDAVVLAEPPWSISALLQRIGRGNRRADIVRAVAIARSPDEHQMFIAMFDAARAGRLLQRPYRPDRSVAIQQLFSYFYQKVQGAPENELSSLLHPLCTPEQTHTILEYLHERGWVEWHRGHWLGTTRLMDLGEEGQIHSNIADSQGFAVIDVDSGDTIGSVGGVLDEVFTLAQRTWRVVSVRGYEIYARRQTGVGNAPIFASRDGGGAFASLLAPALRDSRLGFGND